MLRLRDARVNGALRDLWIRDGRLTAPGPADEEIDLAGRLVVPGFVDAHCHLDKTLWSGPWAPNTAGPRLRDKIDYTRSRRADFGVPSAPRIAELLGTMAAAGTTSVRTHTDVSPEFGLDGFHAVAEAAAALEKVITVEQVAFPQYGLLTNPGTLELMDRALATGLAQVVGGIDPAGVDRDPVAHLDAVFGLATAHDVPVDLHLHDPGTLGAWQFELIIDRTLRAGMEGRVTIGHGYALAELSGIPQDELIAALAAAGIGLATCAAHDDPVVPVLKMRDAGAGLGLGSDGIRDLWSPWGNGDLLDRAHQLASRSGFFADEDLAQALVTATTGGAELLGLTGHGLDEGATADLVVLDAESAAEAVVTRARRLLVLKEGRTIARDGVLTSAKRP
ncbi:amidohydrolase [Actinocorallia longicatena]|uniref:Amidohydrolase family protein n=1 Tax=Actinocorallia longicatena TaxID=111803 RepID=A0ABP6Q7B9_9ACTN